MRGFWACMLALGLGARSASAERDRLALAAADAEFRRALMAALAPAGIEVVPAETTAPATAGEALPASRALVVRAAASAAVWLIATGGASTIFVYDRGVDRVLARPLSYAPPLAPDQAAEAAVMVRTMLRALRATPDVDLAPPRADEAPAVRARAAAELLRPDRGELVLDLGPGVWVDAGAGTTMWKGSGAVAWRRGRVGIALAVSAGDERAAVSMAFDGGYADDSVAATARWAIVGSPRLRLDAGAGLAVHVTRLAGRLAGDGEAEELRLDPAARLELRPELRLWGALSLAGTLTVDALARRQRFLAGSEVVLDVSPIHVGVGLSIGAAVTL